MDMPANASARTTVALSTKQQLVRTAERLFAVHGIEGVSLRQISVEAGMANPTVVQYHFGSKDGLVEAILQSRIEHLSRRRSLLDARAPADDLRAVIEAHLLPVIELGEEDDCYYLMFLEHLMRYSTTEHPLDRLPAEHQASRRHYLARIGRLLPDLPERLRDHRANQASAICFHTCADRQHARRLGADVEHYALHVSQLLDSVVAFVQAPPSTETLAALAAAPRRRAKLRPLP
jgi:AcrR family transcriptional regulator